MGTFYAQYASPAQVSIGAQGTNGAIAPTVSLEVAGINPSGNLSPLAMDASGNLLVSLAAEPVSPFNVNLNQVGGAAISEGQKLMAASLPVVIASDQSTLPISAASLPLPTGAATSALQSAVQSAPGTPQTVAITVQGNASGVALPISAASLPLPTGASTSANQTAVQSAPGSSAGTAITVQGSASGIAIPTTVASLPLPAGAATAANQTNASQKTQIVDGSGNVIASQNNSFQVLQPDSTATGSITSTQSVTININSYSATGISVTGTFTGTLAVEASADGVNYNATTALFLANGQIVSNITAVGQYQANVAGMQTFRIRGNTIATGTAVITIRGSVAIASVMLDNSLPAGSATIGAVTQASGPWTQNLTQVGGSGVTLGSKVSASSIPVVIASDQAAVTIAQATAANLNATVVQGTAANLKAAVNLNDGSGSAVNKGQTTMSGSLPVTIASDQSAVNTTSAGFSAVNHVTNNYTSTPVSTSAYTQILASTSAVVKEVEIFDSSGQSLVLATGAPASEVDQVYIFPGGNGRIRLAIAASTRVSIKAVSANATSGNIYVNFYG